MNDVAFTVFSREWTWGVLLIPVFSGVIGYGTNWVGVKMMTSPAQFVGWRIPWTLFGVPMIGWQGMIPNRVTKLASLSVDTGLAKLGTMSEFLAEMEPEVIAAYIAETQRDEVHRIVDEILAEEYPTLWAGMPTSAKEALHRRVEAQLPGAIVDAMEAVGENVDRLLDVKMMVVRFLEDDPSVMSKLVKEIAYAELKFVIRSGLILGLPLGILPMLFFVFVSDHWAAVPIGAGLVGWLTNYIALKLIFYPAEPRRFGPFKMHGLMLRRKEEIGLAYAKIFAHDLLTVPKIADRMINGPAGDRTRQLFKDSIESVIDDNVGPARLLVKATAGRTLERLETTVTEEAMEMMPRFVDEHAEFIAERQDKLAVLIGTRMGAMDYRQFQKLMRAPFEQDEWLAIMVGAVLGFGAGVIQVFVTLGGA